MLKYEFTPETTANKFVEYLYQTYFSILFFRAEFYCSYQPEVAIEAAELVDLLMAKVFEDHQRFRQKYAQYGIGYLVTTMGNQFKELARKHQRKKVQYEKYLSSYTPDIATIPLDDPTSAVGFSNPEEYFAVIEKYLNPKQYEVFVLSVEGCSYKEIAEELGININDVGTTLGRARKKLRHQFGNIHQAREEIFGTLVSIDD